MISLLVVVFVLVCVAGVMVAKGGGTVAGIKAYVKSLFAAKK